MGKNWDNISVNLSEIMAAGAWQIWIKPLAGFIEGDVLKLYAPNNFVCEKISKYFLSIITQEAFKVIGRQLDIVLKVGKHENILSSETLVPKQSEVPSNIKDVSSSISSTQVALPVFTNPKFVNYKCNFNFSDYIVGPCNELAYVMAKSFSQASDIGMDQLILCSDAGLGKTHLAQAIGLELAKHSNLQRPRIAYLNSEDFGNQIVQALTSKTIEQFKNKYKEHVDVLLLEDIHFFQAKEKMQEILLTTLRSLQSNGKKVVFTSSFLPKEMHKMDESLLSHLHNGGVAKINKLTFETKVKILEHKAKTMKVRLPLQIAEFLASQLRGDVRQLQSCLCNLAFTSKIMHDDPNLEMAKSVLENYLLIVPSVSLDGIVSFICKTYNLQEHELKSKYRKRQFVQARNLVFYFARKHTELSLEQIGQRLNRRHSTVIQGVIKVEQEINRQSLEGGQVLRLEERLFN